MKRVLISTALVLAFICLVFAQTAQMAQTLQSAQTDRQLIDSRPASDTTAADKVDALLASWSRGDTPGAAVNVSPQTYNRVSEKTVKPIRGKKLFSRGWCVMAMKCFTGSERARDKE